MTSVCNQKHDDSLEIHEVSSTPINVDKATVDYFGEKMRLATFTQDIDIDAIPLEWSATTAAARGPVVVSKYKKGMAKHNAIGAHAGPYSIYHALSVASKQLDLNHEPDYTNAHPPFNFPQQEQWSTPGKIVSMDPFGHMVPWIYGDIAKKENVDIKPTMSITKAVLSIPEIKEEVQRGNLIPDGKIVLNDQGEMACTKIAVDPVWHLPGVAQRLNISEAELRKALFQDTNGMYPELISRPDIKVFCPPIGGVTAYIFGDPSDLPKEDKRLALRIHDECSGSDVFLSDICSCRCYLIFGLVEAAKEAQNGGNGLVCYYRKEGRCLGEVTKYLVYNARKRGGDTADEYFHRTECIAGVKDARFQELMPDILHWLGITKIDKMLSMSNMKHDAIVDSGITIDERIEIPDYLLPADSRVEIDAKIAAGYFTNGHVYTTEELKKVEGRKWEGL